ncbi:MAG: PH domain-containing protein [Acidobacteriia bacterium]|nr:PH domain-containing protein [Terriglobia bacterium]
MTHTSRFDWWLLPAIALAIAVLLITHNYWVGGPVLLVLALCAYPQSYQTTPEGLLVRAALTRQLIPYESIMSIGPGERGNRIRIQYGLASELLVAPADRDAFLRDMAAHTPHLTRLGRKLMAIFA